MARLLYALMGDSGGHVLRALVLAREMTGHEFLFLGGGRALELRKAGYTVEPIPMVSTQYSANGVDVLATLANAAKVLARSRSTVERIARIIERYQPSLIVTDYEFFTPLAAAKLGVSCVSVDHQHILTKCFCPGPSGQTAARALLTIPLRFMYSRAKRYLITSFFDLPPKDPESTQVFPPLLNPDLSAIEPTPGEHVLVYLTSPALLALVNSLRKLARPCIVYGLGKRPAVGNLVFKEPSRQAFLEDLASCRYLVSNGGHGAISEALYLQKPVLALPIRLAYEQILNAYMLSVLGYGSCCLSTEPLPAVFDRFENRLDWFREQIGARNFLGNKAMVKRLESLLPER